MHGAGVAVLQILGAGVAGIGILYISTDEASLRAQARDLVERAYRVTGRMQPDGTTTLQTPDAGEIEVLGENMVGRSEDEAKNIRRRWGILFQNGALFSTLTVAENVEVPIREYFPFITPPLLESAPETLALLRFLVSPAAATSAAA